MIIETLKSITFYQSLGLGVLLYVVVAAALPPTRRNVGWARLLRRLPFVLFVAFRLPWSQLFSSMMLASSDTKTCFVVGAVCALLSGGWSCVRIAAGRPINPLHDVPETYVGPTRGQRLFTIAIFTAFPFLLIAVCFTPFSQYLPLLPDGPLAHWPRYYLTAGLFIAVCLSLELQRLCLPKTPWVVGELRDVRPAPGGPLRVGTMTRLPFQNRHRFLPVGFYILIHRLVRWPFRRS